jgi:hypothetical protein
MEERQPAVKGRVSTKGQKRTDVTVEAIREAQIRRFI